ncbi:hypothetical protein F7725_004036 [Dissostichus mawsoni]|uniref:Endonuclease/exonuclease/phosphatase domain-containing protein n=1 Tax=Dissostichus mawsoni TaxID=36200 RepID=A0A7J5YF82_DISMA|nr:hypothetical protein F7725_004036 [Dissostichus mawsoni]
MVLRASARMRLLCALGLFLALLHVTSCLLIGAFNIQNFGTGKFDKPEAIDIIKRGTTEFSYIVSEPLPLGSSIFPLRSHKERYLFLYRNQKVSVKGSFQYTEKVFDRPPFVVKFSSTETAVKEFVLIPIHTSPLTAAQAAKEGKNSTVEQLNALVDVVEEAKLKWTNNNIMVLGDFNAGSRYVGDGHWKNIRLRANTNFHWLIADNVATTMAEKSKQAHDRIVVTTEMEKGVVAGSAAVFDFIKAYSPKESKEVSNHFPVEVELKPSRNTKKRQREMRLLCALGLFLALLHVTSCLLIGAFNIQCFGDKKSQDKAGSPQFSYVVSEPLPLGPSTYKERYLFLYRYQKVTVTDSFQYTDTPDVFERPPSVVKFSSRQTAVKEFVLIPIHTKPGNAVVELRALVDVVKRAETKWLNKNIMVLGDFNAGSNYVPISMRPTIPLFNTTVFHWLIDNNVDTTVSRRRPSVTISLWRCRYYEHRNHFTDLQTESELPLFSWSVS